MGVLSPCRAWPESLFFPGGHGAPPPDRASVDDTLCASEQVCLRTLTRTHVRPPSMSLSICRFAARPFSRSPPCRRRFDRLCNRHHRSRARPRRPGCSYSPPPPCPPNTPSPCSRNTLVNLFAPSPYRASIVAISGRLPFLVPSPPLADAAQLSVCPPLPSALLRVGRTRLRCLSLGARCVPLLVVFIHDIGLLFPVLNVP